MHWSELSVHLQYVICSCIFFITCFLITRFCPKSLFSFLPSSWPSPSACNRNFNLFANISWYHQNLSTFHHRHLLHHTMLVCQASTNMISWIHIYSIHIYKYTVAWRVTVSRIYVYGWHKEYYLPFEMIFFCHHRISPNAASLFPRLSAVEYQQSQY